MAEKKKFSMAKLANDYCPEGFEDAKDNYVRIDDIIGKEIEIVKFDFVVSTNLEKYNAGNEEGVHIMFRLEDEKELSRTLSHSKQIVKGFKNLEKAIGGKVLIEPIVTKIIKKPTKDNHTMYDFEF